MSATLVLGLGESGLAMVRWLSGHGRAEVRVADTRAEPPMLGALRTQWPHVKFAVGFDAALLDGVTQLAVSPGLSLTDGDAATLIAAARARDIEVVGEIELFARALAALKAERGYAPRVVGVTGTNGKTTTTRLTGLLIESAGKSVAVAGNISPTALDALHERIATQTLPEVWVLELSSFQLASTQSLVCDAATVLNVTQDHLDWHGSFEGYAQAKARIFAPGTVQVLNRDDAEVMKRAVREKVEGKKGARGKAASGVVASHVAVSFPHPSPLPEGEGTQHSSSAEAALGHSPLPPGEESMKASLAMGEGSVKASLPVGEENVKTPLPVGEESMKTPLPMGEESMKTPLAMGEESMKTPLPMGEGVGVREALPQKLGPSLITFGTDAPTQPDSYGLVFDGGVNWLAYAEDLSAGMPKKRKGADVPAEIHLHRLMPADALRIRGRHNAMNALAALALARALGCALAPMLHALREYVGEPHRVEWIATIDEVEYYDDSKGTNVGATVAALDGLASPQRKLSVILGGDGKGQDFSALLPPLARHARAVALIGRDAETLAALLADAAYPVQRCDDLPSAVQFCARNAQAGDAVLLSPACASLDMFRNYAHRAEVFVEAVREHAAERGQPC